MVLLPTLLIACSGEPDEGLPERTVQAPLEEENLAPEVLPTDDHETPEDLTVTSGFNAPSLHWWAHMRGWVHADIEEVWSALRVPDVMADRRVIDSYTVSDEGHRDDVDFSYVLSSEMSMPGRTFAFDITWLHTVEEGDLRAPTLVVARWDLTEGPPFIQQISGSVELEKVDEDLTEIRGIFHMRAFPVAAGAMEQFWRDLHADVLSTLEGVPVDTYD